MAGTMSKNIPEVRYAICWTENDGIHWCGHQHLTIGEAMGCLIPDGRHFIRAWENGTVRSLNDPEIIIYLSEVWRIRQNRASA